MNKNGILAIIAIALIGILAVMVANYNERSQSPAQKIADSLDNVTDKISDEINSQTAK